MWHVEKGGKTEKYIFGKDNDEYKKWYLCIVEPSTFSPVSELTLSKVKWNKSTAAVFQSDEEILCWPDLVKRFIVVPLRDFFNTRKVPVWYPYIL